MKTWQGIDRNSDATAEGTWTAINLDYTTDGEVSRRPGTVLASANSGIGLINHWQPVSGYLVVYATSTGSLVSVAVP